MKYAVCKNCGAHLDHGEPCDCIKKAPKQASLNGAKEIGSFTYDNTKRGRAQEGSFTLPEL